jgi:uncharacterized protein YgbK (DUF1537 family)
MVSLAQDNLPPATEVLAAQPPARPDDEELRASIRALRAGGTDHGPLRLGVLDDDPTGSQAVHDVQVVTVEDQDAYGAALAGDAGVCFVLTNTRSLDEADAVALNERVGRGLLAAAAAGTPAGRVQLVSRSDSTLRGHVMAEVGALQAVQEAATGRGFDGVLLAPAFLEAGRITAGDIHWARVAGELVPVGDTEFARDATFGYSASDLRDFIAEKGGARVRPDDVVSLSLADIRVGGAARVADVLSGVRDGQWVVVNATEYSDLDTVAFGVLLAEQAGQSFLFRTGPSFVRSLAGMGPKAPLGAAELFGQDGAPGAAGHGLVVVGSHVGQTSRQVAALRARGGVAEVELDVPALLDGADVVGAAAGQVAAALAESDVVLYTSRTLVRGQDRDGSLAIARTVSAALSQVVREALPAGPAWVVAKGGITSHDVAVRGLGIRRAEVAGQLFPGVISVFQPLDAAPEARGRPYVVFAGNVGDDGTLADVVAILNGEQEGA